METCFWLHRVLGWSLSLLLVALPGPLGAGTPGHNSTSPVTQGFYRTATAEEAAGAENGATSDSFSRESLSPSQRDLLLTSSADRHAVTAANFDFDQRSASTETSSMSPEAPDLSTEPLTSSFTVTMETSSSISIGNSGRSSISSSSDPTNTNKMPVISDTVSPEERLRLSTEDESLSQDSPDVSLRLGDATSLASHTAAITEGAYSTTIGRAGERTLLSVTSPLSNSTTSALTESSHQPPSTGRVPPRPAETEGYTQSSPSMSTNGEEAMEPEVTGTYSETGSPGVSVGTKSLPRQANSTELVDVSTSHKTSDWTPSPGLTEPITEQSGPPVSSTPSITSHTRGILNASGADQGFGTSVGTSTETAGGVESLSTQNQESTKGLTSRPSEDSTMSLGLTAAPSTVSSTPDMDVSPTDTPAFFPTTLASVTESKAQTVEERTSEETAFTTSTLTSTASPLPATPSTAFSSTTSYTSEPLTETTVLYAAPSSTLATLSSSTTHPTLQVSPSQTQALLTQKVPPAKAPTVESPTSEGVQTVATTQSPDLQTTYTQSIPASSTEAQRATRRHPDGGATEMANRTLPPDDQTVKLPPRNPCVSNPCMNGGMCMSYKGPEYFCQCQQAWTGSRCEHDIDECEKDPCPAGSTCVNTKGSFSCDCPLGYDLKDGRACSKAKTFLGTFSFNRQVALYDTQREILQLLNVSLSVLQGYSRSTLSKKERGGLCVLVVNMFSISADVTTTEVNNSIQMSLRNCNSSLTHCRMVLQHQLSYRVESLCEAQTNQCDAERSTCTDSSGTASCQCLQGYYKQNPDDSSCLECRDGYRLENGSCVPCMFGFGGFNCGNFYKLIAIVVLPAGGALLLILIIALVVTCCKKKKNDINKIIFKSGDMQMSPYADFPKNNRISMEWGRETIEMQENGSTKNLLQMTDIYYSPALRNADLERNGLYPYSGLPGSRHSCIYPAQWNPSFICDDSRRRDYF